MADMADKTPLSDTELDDLFQAARGQAPAPSQDLMARVMADADAVLDATDTAPAPVTNGPGWFARMRGAVGGWPALAGLAVAAGAGVMIGLWSPDVVDDWTGGSVSAALGYELNDLVPSVDALLGEG